MHSVVGSLKAERWCGGERVGLAKTVHADEPGPWGLLALAPLQSASTLQEMILHKASQPRTGSTGMSGRIACTSTGDGTSYVLPATWVLCSKAVQNTCWTTYDHAARACQSRGSQPSGKSCWEVHPVHQIRANFCGPQADIFIICRQLRFKAKLVFEKGKKVKKNW